ncbi:protein-glutamine gamma-glutamyltransferase K-like, partial [Oculina patagonica]
CISAGQLEAQKVNLHKEENREAHKTDEYEIDQLILRRGQSFDVTVTFNRDYNSQTDVITLQFVTGKNPQQSKRGGIVRVQKQDTLILSKWGWQVKEANGNTVRLSVMSSSQAAIGYYDVMVETKSKDSTGEQSLHRHKHEEQICILFNAWCQDDVVFMENNEDLDLDVDEYVLKEAGHIWRGSWRRFSKIPWNFGQFDDVVLKSALWLLKKAELSPKSMSNVIHVVRTMTSMVNSADRGGVLEGRWAEDFPDGKVPWHWSGSVEILELFWNTKETVKYGQCWVFSGLLTSLLRALGIPTRSVTNFESAHDTEKSLTIDYHFDADGKAEKSYNNDSVWNYHVWNECWFKRLDLPDGHDGWQAIDGTPQEQSGGIYQCGPASVNAIKNGEVYLHYDTDFIFAEVNADKVYWEVPFFDGELRTIQIDEKSTGKCISTRKPGKTTVRSDLTNHYKHPEGSDAERRVVEFVNKFSSKKDLEIYDPAVKDVNCKLDVVDEVKIGEAFKANATVKNESSEKRTVTSDFTAILVHYTGRAAKTLKEQKTTVVLEPGEEKGVTLDILTRELLGKSAVPDASIKIFMRGSVDETDQRFALQDVVEFMKPELKVTVLTTPLELNKDVTVSVSLTNPLPIDLTNGKFHFEFSRNMEPKTMVVDCKGPVRANKKTEITATFIAVNRLGFRSVSVNFNSSEITGIVGDAYFYVSN